MFRGRWASPLDERAVLAPPPPPEFQCCHGALVCELRNYFLSGRPPLATLGCLNIEIGGAGAALGKLTSHKKTFVQVAKLFPSTVTLERCAMTRGCGTRTPCWLLVGLRWGEGYLVLGGRAVPCASFLCHAAGVYLVPARRALSHSMFHVPCARPGARPCA